MKRLLSWTLLLLLVTVHTSPVAADECDGVFVIGAKGAKAITAPNDKASVEITFPKPEPKRIQVYMNMDEANDINCEGQSGKLSIVDGGKCDVEYTYKDKKLNFKVKGKPIDDIAYEEEAPHLAVLNLDDTGLSIRGPSAEATTTPIADTADCWKPSDPKWKLAAPNDACLLQLEFKDNLQVAVKAGNTNCADVVPKPSPSDAPETTVTKPTGITADPVSSPTGSTTGPASDPTGSTASPGPVSGRTPDPVPIVSTADPGPVSSDATKASDPTTATTAGSTTTEADSTTMIIIIVCAVLGVIILIIAIVLVWWFCCRKKKDSEEDAEAAAAAEGGDQDAEAEGAAGAPKSEKKEPEAGETADGPEAENTQKDSEKKGSDQTQSEGADNTQNE